MKIPLRYQNTEYDCGTTTFINALAYLYDREDIPVELLKAIHQLSLDVRDSKGVVGKGGTSAKHAELIAKFFSDYAAKHADFSVNCEILYGKDASANKIRKALDEGGVAIARCWQNTEHYVLITKISDDFVYLFDPYYLDKNFYDKDDDVAMVFHEEFTHNRIVKISRVFDDSEKDYSLTNGDERAVIILKRQ
jgi:hypothetical protein